jgi:hypothetical protein
MSSLAPFHSIDCFSCKRIEKRDKKERKKERKKEKEKRRKGQFFERQSDVLTGAVKKM